MKILWVVLGVIGVALVIFALGWANALRATAARNREIEHLMAPAIKLAAENSPSAREKVAELAAALPAVRNQLFRSLKEMGKAELFPAAFRTPEKVAEADLARWLMHPNELASAPTHMQLVRPIPVEEAGRTGTVYLFKFRIDPPHWAAKDGWLAGVAGPYWKEGESPDEASGTFSELVPFEKLSEDEHVNLLKKALQKNGLVVRAGF